MRGFNQAGVLASLVALEAGISVRSDLLQRTRSTTQQAKQDSQDMRLSNVRGAFKAPRGPANCALRRVGLVDDLVTGGATCEAAAQVLSAAGWHVCWVAALGMAAAVGTRQEESS